MPHLRRLGAASLLGLVLLACTGGAAAPAGAATARFHACAGHYGVDGDPAGRFYRRLRARRTGCRTANRVTRAWVTFNAQHDGADPTGRIRVAGYSCHGTVVPDSAGSGTSGIAVRCSRGARAVTFYGHG